MLVPTFVDLQGFIVNKKFIVKEVGMLKQGSILTHYFYDSRVIEIFDKIQQVLHFMVQCLSLWIAMEEQDDPVQRDEKPDHDSYI